MEPGTIYDRSAGRLGAASAARPLTICYPFSGDIVGGSHISVVGLVANLDRARYRPLVVPQCPDGAVAALFRDHGIAVDRSVAWTRLPRRSIGLLTMVTGLIPQIRFLRRERVDIVHTNDGHTHARWALAARLGGAKLLWHHRGHPAAKGLRYAAPLLANRVIAVSDFASPDARPWSAARKTEVVHSPFDTRARPDRSAARAALLAERGLPRDTLLLGYFGALIDRKRPLLFVDAVARVRALLGGRQVAGVMFGKADDPAVDAALRAHIGAVGASGYIHAIGYRSPGTDWIAACDQLVVPAIDEPFGRTLIEAMLVGTPVVATRSGGNVEALRNGAIGILVEPEDAGALAEGCALLARDPGLAAAIAASAQMDARQRFGEERHCARISQIYTELMGIQR